MVFVLYWAGNYIFELVDRQAFLFGHEKLRAPLDVLDQCSEAVGIFTQSDVEYVNPRFAQIFQITLADTSSSTVTARFSIF